MRSVPGFTHSSARITSASAIVTDTRLTFVDNSPSVGVPENGLADQMFAYDAGALGTGILRVASVDIAGEKKLHYQYVFDLTDAVWPVWIDSGIILAPYCKPGVYAERVFYRGSDGNDYRRDFTVVGEGVTLGGATLLFAGNANAAIAFAPVSLTDYYVHYQYYDHAHGPDWNFGLVALRTTSGGDTAWPGRTYGPDQHTRFFDAVRLSGNDYIYLTDKDELRTQTITRISSVWSDLSQLFPLDVIDDTSLFRMSGAVVINGRIFVCGSLWRPYGDPMQVYTIGPAPYTFGRDMFIGTHGATSWTVVSGATYLIPSLGGLLHLVGDTLWHVGVGTIHLAPATTLVGYDNAARKLSLTSLTNIRLQQSLNGPSALSFDIPYSTSHAAFRAGSEIELTVAINAYSTVMGKFGIDSIIKDRDSEGQGCSVLARSLAMKNITQWSPDSSYDFWSQTKVSTNPAGMDELARVTGDWEDNEDFNPLVPGIRMVDLNIDGAMYSVAKASRGGITRARFFRPSGDYTPRYGLFLNYYLGKVATIQDNEIVPMGDVNTVTMHNGLAVVYSATEHAGAAGIGIYMVRNGAWTKLTNYALTIPADTWHWLQAQFSDGLISVSYRLNTATTWTDVCVNLGFGVLSEFPWGHDEEGHGGMYIKNGTDLAYSPGFFSDSDIIPVRDQLTITAPDTVLVDEEQIAISALSPNYVDLPPLTWREGVTWMQAPHDNVNWVDGQIYGLELTCAAQQGICDDAANKYVGRSFSLPVNATVRRAKFRIKKVGSPTRPIYCYLTNRKFDDEEPPDMDEVETYISVAAASVGTEYSWIEFVFPVPEVCDTKTYWLYLTNGDTATAPLIDAVNYYILELSEQERDPYGSCKIYGGTDWRKRSPDAAIPFYLYGDMNSGTGYEIYFIGHDTPPLARTYYNDMALVIHEGAGKGSVFKITDYDSYAPTQWIPSQSYTPPDTWQEHVGDAEHGDWSWVDARRFFVEQSPTATFGIDSIVHIMPTLIVSQRGVNDTVATSHSPIEVDADRGHTISGNASLLISAYRDVSVLCNLFEHFTSETDMTYHDLAVELARKSGVLDNSTDYVINATASFTGSGWLAANAPYDAWTQKRNLILNIRRPSAAVESGILFRATKNGSNYVGGRAVTVSATAINMYDLTSGSFVLLRSIPTTEASTGWITISVQDTLYSVWVNRRLLGVFTDTTTPSGDYAHIVSFDTSTLEVQWQQMDRRVDNFILDIGKRGSQLLQRLTGEKHYWYQDNNAGALRTLSLRPDVNPAAPYVLSLAAGDEDSENDYATRLRIEGAEIAELFDATKLALHGNLFSVLNLSEINTLAEAEAEATYILGETERMRSPRTLIGGMDPRLEPGDIITATVSGATWRIAIEKITFVINIDDKNVIADMTLEGYHVD